MTMSKLTGKKIKKLKIGENSRKYLKKKERALIQKHDVSLTAVPVRKKQRKKERKKKHTAPSTEKYEHRNTDQQSIDNKGGKPRKDTGDSRHPQSPRVPEDLSPHISEAREEGRLHMAHGPKGQASQ